MFGRRRRSERVAGFPTSSNRASSMHLFWDLPGEFRAVSVTLEVLGAPRVPRLYFWALQAGFADRGRRLGAGHLGLQWFPMHPGSTAVNWGGYAEGGGELPGTRSALHSTPGNPNTSDFPWQPARPYRLTIQAGTEPGWWVGLVEDLLTGEVTIVRELQAGGTGLVQPMVWSEVFARCEEPSAMVRWSDPLAVDEVGGLHRPRGVTVNYQDVGAGGCTNTTAGVDSEGLWQATATGREVPQGARLDWPH